MSHYTIYAMTRVAVALFLLTLFLSGCLLLGLASGLQSSQSISSHGVITYTIVFRAHGTSEFPQEQMTAEVITKNLDMFRCWYYYSHGKLVQEIHSIRPDVICLLYRNVRAIYDYSDEWQMALDKGWILKDSSGKLVHSTIWPRNYMVDIGNTEYQKWVASWIKGYLDKYGFDGVFSDCGFHAITGIWGGVTAQPMNPRTGNSWTSDEVIEAWCSLHREIRRAIGSKLNIVNGIFHGERFWRYQTIWVKLLSNCEIDGFMSEGLFNFDSGFYSEDKWKKSVDFVVWIQENFLKQAGKIYLPHSRCAVDLIPADCTSEQMATFAFSSLLLGINKSQNCLSLMGAMLSNEVQNLFKIDLGVPKGNYYVIEGTHVYARDFTKIKVLVNPTDHPYSVNLDGDYETLEGQIVSSVNMEPHTGLILKVTF